MNSRLSTLLALTACCGAACNVPLRHTHEPAATASSPAPALDEEPATSTRLVVVVVFDQWPTWALAELLPHLDPNGAIRTAIEHGTYFERARYPYAATYTAPGHTAIYTGEPPSRSGIMNNVVVDPQTGQRRSIVDDGEHAVFGNARRYAGPAMLRVPTVGDALHRATSGVGKVVSLSLKDRSAVLPGGHTANFVAWYDDQIPGFTTSTRYASELPAILEPFHGKAAIAGLLVPWTAGDPELLEKAVGPDDQEGEGDWEGLGRVFPHNPRESRQPYQTLRATPMLGEMLIELALDVAADQQLGKDDVCDLLAISLSNTDYVAHVFGPQSWEYLDNLRRMDIALATALRKLDAERGPIAVMLTSDHGDAPLLTKAKIPGGRLYPGAVAKAAREAAERVLGPGTWVEDFERPMLMLSRAAEIHPRRAELVETLEASIEALAGVRAVHDLREARTWTNHDDPIKRAIALSIHESAPPALYVLVEPGWIIDEFLPGGGAGTTHGTPWDYDTDVPVIVWGIDVPKTRHAEPVSALRVAATIATLLGIPWKREQGLVASERLVSSSKLPPKR